MMTFLVIVAMVVVFVGWLLYNLLLDKVGDLFAAGLEKLVDMFRYRNSNNER